MQTRCHFVHLWQVLTTRLDDCAIGSCMEQMVFCVVLYRQLEWRLKGVVNLISDVENWSLYVAEPLRTTHRLPVWGSR